MVGTSKSNGLDPIIFPCQKPILGICFAHFQTKKNVNEAFWKILVSDLILDYVRLRQKNVHEILTLSKADIKV